MALVTVTYNAWDHNRQVVPAAWEPRVFFRPLSTSLASGMMTHREVQGSLDPATGAGQVQLESAPGLLYVPFMDWLVPDVSTLENRSRGYAEWDPIFPAQGGPIDELPPAVPSILGGFYYGLGAPPQFLRTRSDVVYIDISGGANGWWDPWVPEGTLVEGGA